MKDLPINQYFIGDCIDIIKNKIPDRSVNCVITSPPYAMQRQSQYGGISEEDYPAWTVEYMQEIERVLVDDGNVAIIIRPHLAKGEISDYMLKTRLAIRAAGWYECEELIWVKPDSPPMGSFYRPRRAWESIHWFSRTPKPFCDTMANGKKSNRIGMESTKGLGDYIHAFGKSIKGVARAPDYVKIGTSRNDKTEGNIHPAQYPVPLVEWLIKLLCPVDGVVLDPFLGSGTTAVAAINTERSWIGCEISDEYEDIIEKRISEKYHEDYEDWISY